MIHTINQAKNIIEKAYKADLPVLLYGATGVGKSEATSQVAVSLGIKFISVDLSCMEACDILGLPIIDTASNRTRWVPPSIFPTSGKGIFVFEELNRAPRHVQAPTLNLLTSRKVGEYSLPKGWLPIACCNPAGDDSEYFVSELDPALEARFLKIHLNPSRTEWISWAKTNGIHPKVIAFCEINPDIFTGLGNPRAWVYLSNLLNANPEILLDNDAVVLGCLSGLVGPNHSNAFSKFLNNRDHPLSAVTALCSFKTHEKQMKTWLRSGRIDLVKSTMKNLIDYLKVKSNVAKYKEDKKQKENLLLFIGNLPGDNREELISWLAGVGIEVNSSGKGK